jgi:hypothetical protein
MGFSDQVKKLAKSKSAHRCCVCHKPFVEIHHLLPQKEGGPDTIENAAPLCASCHDLYGGNPEKRKALTQMRDDWWLLMEKRRQTITEASEIDDFVLIDEEPNHQGSLRNQKVALYHLVFADENFETAVEHIFSVVQAAQKHNPNMKRYLFLDIEGHRNPNGGFDHDMYELQRHFILGSLASWLCEIYIPLGHFINKKLNLRSEFQNLT